MTRQRWRLKHSVYVAFWLGLPLLWLALGGLWLWLYRGASALGLGVLWLGTALLLILATRRLFQPLRQVDQVARSLAHGRHEQRVPPDIAGPLAPLATSINHLGRTLTQLRDHQDSLVLQTTARLKADQERLQQLNNEMRQTLIRTQTAARSQSELFANLSHELRTPLTGILGYADLLRRSELDPEQEQYLETLDKSARGLLTMINDLLDWSRIEAGRLRLHEERFSIDEVAEDVITLLAPLAYQKDLELVRIVYHDVPAWLSGDPQRLRQILTNLVSNAIKFTERGEVVLRVMQEREDQRHIWLRFAISDSGIGISEEQQARLFQPFSQAGASFGGSGLGLSICRKLAELMGGQIELDSTVGEGSTFSAVLPLRIPAESPTPAVDRRMAGETVWLLESHATARLALTHWLAFWGLDVVHFDSPEALESRLQLTHGLPQAIILGLHPRDVERCRGLLARCADREPPLLALVASASLDVQLQLRALGAAACLPKCAGKQALQQALLEMGSRARAPRPLTGHAALVADNNLANLRYLALLCVELGLDVYEAADGEQALELWTTHRPDYVLLDARMPRLDGAGCARAIREAQGSARPRIVAVSAHLEPDERRSFLDAGADAILLKPFDERQLLNALQPDGLQPPPPSSHLLGQDPEMLQLLAEELPLQLAELETACRSGTLSQARDAAHQLRGTAAFYHLGDLRQCAGALESELTRIQQLEELEETLPAAARAAVTRALDDIEQRLRR